MTRHASVGAGVETFQITKSSGGAVRVTPVGPRVGTQPVLSGTVTAFAGNAFTHLEGFPAPRHRNARERRVARGAAAVRRWSLDSESVADLFGARGGQRCEGALRMKILQRPDVELILVLSAAAVAAGAGAGSRAEKFRRIVSGRRRFCAQCDCRKRNPSGEKRGTKMG